MGKLCTRIDLSTPFHPQIARQSDQLILLMSVSYILGGHWDQFLPLFEFAYNNSYNLRIDMAPFEALYER